MSPGYFLYNILFFLLGPPALAAAAVRGRLNGGWMERLGLVSGPPLGQGPRIWLHAVSAGEIQVASDLFRALKELRPGADIWLTSSTSAGRTAALDLGLPVVAFPIDCYRAPDRALARLCPDLVIILETEIWPNFLRAAGKRGVKVMLAHGRISPRSFNGYKKAGFFFREVLKYFDLMAMISPDDVNRIVSLGADPARVTAAGGAKPELAMTRVDNERASSLRREYGIHPDRPVITAGSTRSGEEKIILDVFSRLKIDFPELHLILAPRHVGRADEVEGLIRRAGLTLYRRSRGTRVSADGPARGRTDVSLVDVMGELFYLYEPCRVAFCGASLVPKGGQNILEPAAWGRPVLYGPYMEDFIEAREILEKAGAGLTVNDRNEFYETMRALLSDQERAEAMGRAGRAALEGYGGTSARLAELALSILTMDKKENN